MKQIQQHNLGQVFITDTHTNRMENLLKKYNLEYQLIHVKDGSINNG